ncbi:histone H2A type 1-H-like [Scyliorhinus torazame]|uniref:histone H2A type 1-H-like n=1 Tax=Scyliorhinus torazame TaxID=75743 RepID=UPI003B58F2CD
MDDGRSTKGMFSCELAVGMRLKRTPSLQYKDDVQSNVVSRIAAATTTGRIKTGGKGTAKTKAHSFRVGLQFPVGCMHQLLCKGHYAEQVGAEAGARISQAIVLAYLTTENAAWDKKNTFITPCHLQLAISDDEEFNKLLEKVTIAKDRVMPNIQAVLLPKKTRHSYKVYA